MWEGDGRKTDKINKRKGTTGKPQISSCKSENHVTDWDEARVIRTEEYMAPGRD